MTDRFAYLTYLLGWGLPVLGFQLIGTAARYRSTAWRVLKCVVPPALVVTAWLSAADHWAIKAGVWRFGEAQTLGIRFGRVPLEEILFFLITNLMVALGWALLRPADRTR